MNRVGFFGGCFNPPSNIHIELANNLLKQKKVDKVVFVPVGDFYDKKDLAKAIHRYNMIQIAITNYSNIEVEDMEIKENRELYAIDIFEMITNKYKNEDIFFIMGSDNFNNIENWKEYDKLKKYNYIILERKESIISSTEIRKLIKENKNLNGVLDNNVYKYIKENKLYI